MPDIVFGVSEFVAVLNQTLEYAYPNVSIVGELANFRISKNRLVYFDLKDDDSSVKFFGTVYTLPGPLEDGMMLEVRGMPRLHPQYGFSLTAQNIKPVGEGAIKKAAALLEAKLEDEGLFAPERKRSLPYPPSTIGLITSSESAAYADFIKIINKRWCGVEISLADTQVQGDAAVGQILEAIEYFNQLALPPEILVIIRGGGSAEDLAVFSTEQITRAVATSRIPTVVAVGHESDISLAELAADLRASTPSNAAELIVPDKSEVLQKLSKYQDNVSHNLNYILSSNKEILSSKASNLNQMIENALDDYAQRLDSKTALLLALSPNAIINRGYAIVRRGGLAIGSGKNIKSGENIEIELKDSIVDAQTKNIRLK